MNILFVVSFFISHKIGERRGKKKKNPNKCFARCCGLNMAVVTGEYELLVDSFPQMRKRELRVMSGCLSTQSFREFYCYGETSVSDVQK